MTRLKSHLRLEFYLLPSNYLCRMMRTPRLLPSQRSESESVTFELVDFIIEMCTKKHKSAPTESLKNMYKLLCNALYGKMIEGVFGRMDCKFNFMRERALKPNISAKYSLTQSKSLTTSVLFDIFEISFFLSSSKKAVIV